MGGARLATARNIILTDPPPRFACTALARRFAHCRAGEIVERANMGKLWWIQAGIWAGRGGEEGLMKEAEEKVRGGE